MIDFIQEKFTLVFILINVLFHYTQFSLSFIDAFQYHMTNPRHTGNPQKLALGLFVGKHIFQNIKLTRFVRPWSYLWDKVQLLGIAILLIWPMVLFV